MDCVVVLPYCLLLLYRLTILSCSCCLAFEAIKLRMYKSDVSEHATVKVPLRPGLIEYEVDVWDLVTA